MPTIIPLQSEPCAYDTRVTIEEVRYTLQLRWNWRTEDWRISVFDIAAGDYIATNRRMSSGSMVVSFPTGQLYVFGADPYVRKDLGSTLSVIYYTNAELLTLRKDAALGVDPAFTLV